jgi:hypothetical protein
MVSLSQRTRIGWMVSLSQVKDGSTYKNYLARDHTQNITNLLTLRIPAEGYFRNIIQLMTLRIPAEGYSRNIQLMTEDTC